MRSGKLCPLAINWVPIIISLLPREILSNSSFNDLADLYKSEDNTVIDASGKVLAASSASLSTPGPIGAKLPITLQLGHIVGITFVSPH